MVVDSKLLNKKKALGITSGGLDSILSALVLKDQGIDVSWICFKTPFFSSDAAVRSAKTLNIPLKVEDITEIYLSLLKAPQAGFGKNMNPCMDCHALMFEMAGKEMKRQQADFLFSGEVVGQRPKSQTKNSMRYVEKNSGFAGLILRPLSAKLLLETIPEQKGWVDRSRLLDISGRSRKIQMEMAEKYGIKDYPTPAGGCLLTDAAFSNKLRDLMYVQKNYEIRELYLLKHGRHFRIDNRLKVIVGRSKEDNDNILKYYQKDKDTLINPASLPGPVVLIVSGDETDKIEKTGGLICASYTKAKPGDLTDIHIVYPDKDSNTEKIFQVKARQCSDFKELMV
ncbi:MAG: tRNA 4-thiouridine(8) synthase ThiI [Desulfobacteraceae bacterium]|nr:tRNA 4-thiouridine(8) synthase ThiI [Desulfobacteraceae bacterium]